MADAAPHDSKQITLTFPDGATRKVEAGTTGLSVAKAISPSLAKRTVAMSLDGNLADLADPITKDAAIKFIARTDPEALELIRHDAAHVMAEAVQALWPKTQVTIGPVIDNGFYYDFAKQEPFHPDDLAKIEKKMGEIIAKNAPFTKEFWSRKQAKDFFRERGENFKVELVDAIPEDQELKIYKQGEWLDLCRGPHMTSTGAVGKAFKLQKISGAYWRGDPNRADAAADLRHRLGHRGRAQGLPAPAGGSREARPPQARPRDGPVPFPGGGAGLGVLAPEGLDAVPDAHRLHAPPPRRGRLQRGQLSRHDGEELLGALRPLGELSRDDVLNGASRRAHLLLQADELPRPRADLQARPQELSRLAAEDLRVRQGAPLRAVGRHARPPARAPLHAGRRAHLHHRGAAGRAVPRSERSAAVDLRGLRLQGHRRQAVDAAGKARRHGRAMGPRRGDHGQGAEGDREARSRGASRRRSTPAKAPSMARSSSTC